MNSTPQKFFIGRIDFFSVLPPSALLTCPPMGEVGPVVLGDRYDELVAGQGWAAFLFASYLFGHMVFLLGSWLDELYGWARRYTLNTQMALLARRGGLSVWLVRTLLRMVFMRKSSRALDLARKINQRTLGALRVNEAINKLQWSRARLNFASPASLVAVQRFEAHSKFFHRFAVVLLLLLLAWPWQSQRLLAGIPEQDLLSEEVLKNATGLTFQSTQTYRGGSSPRPPPPITTRIEGD